MKTENSIHFHIYLLYSFDRLQSTELFISETRRFTQLRYKQQVITKINNEELLTFQYQRINQNDHISSKYRNDLRSRPLL